MDTWTTLWMLWLFAFVCLELTAVILKRRTLSAQAWAWFSLSDQKRYWMVRRAVFVIFWLLLGVHFVFQAPSLWTVILPGIPFVAVIILSSFVWKDATVSQPKVILANQKGKVMKQKLLNGLVYGAAGVIAAMQATGIPSDAQGWLGLGGVFLTAFWAKVSSSEAFLSPNRPVWSPERRAVEGGK